MICHQFPNVFCYTVYESLIFPVHKVAIETLREFSLYSFVKILIIATYISKVYTLVN